jgi:hypothetical protein
VNSRLLCITALAVALAACKPTAPETAEPEADPAVTEQPAVQPADPLAREGGPERPDLAMPERDKTPVDAKVVNVRLSNSGDTEKHTLGAPTDKFGAKDTVYAEVETSGSAKEYTIYAKWMTADGTVLADYGMRVDQPGTKRTVISLSKPDGWPSGKNSIELAINGKTERTVTFEVP